MGLAGQAGQACGNNQNLLGKGKHMRRFVKIPTWLFVVALACCMTLYGVGTAPASCSGDESRIVMGGACTDTCQKKSACEGCTGPCTGQADGTICGHVINLGEKWFCGSPIEGGVCHLGPYKAFGGKNCKCQGQVCTATSEDGICANAPQSCSSI